MSWGLSPFIEQAMSFNIIVDRYKDVDPVAPRYLGERVQKRGRLCGQKRCDYYGEYFHWDSANKEKYILSRNWNFKKGEPYHCGNSRCEDYHRRWLRHQERLMNEPDYMQQHSMNLFKQLKKRRFVR